MAKVNKGFQGNEEVQEGCISEREKLIEETTWETPNAASSMRAKSS
jgi:hypothetical protein